MYVCIFRHLDKVVAGAGRPSSLLAVATVSSTSLRLLLDIIRKRALAGQPFCIRTTFSLPL